MTREYLGNMHDGYRCNCGKIYDDLSSAAECANCGPEYVSICDTCNAGYFDEDLARECEESHNE
jgi:hypothetical protein